MIKYAAFAMLACVMACVARADEAKPPNIILMLADDLGYGDTGFMGATKIKTPNIDRLAREGIHFTDAHSSGSVCQPTRYGILSGRYYWRRGKVEPGYYFQEGEILLPEVLRQSGYTTAMFGKWHLGWGRANDLAKDVWNGPIRPCPNDAGFDYSFAQASGHEWPPFVFIENDRVYKGDPDDPVIMSDKSPAYWPYAGGQGSSHGAKAAHDAYDVTRLDLTMAERSIEWMKEQEAAGKPFFVYLPFFAPHVPLMPSDKFKGTSEAGLLGDFIQQLDAAAGMVLDYLEQSGLAENTLVVFTSDNGGCYIQEAMDLGHRSMGTLLGLKGDAWEGGHRVPFIARWPGRIPAGASCDKLLSLTDLFPTFVAAARIILPRNAAPDGLNQLPLLQHPQGAPAIRDSMVHMGKGAAALRSGDWVYLPLSGSMGLFGTFYLEQMGFTSSDFNGNELRPDAPPAQLYNLGRDLGQSTNVYQAHPEIAAQMDERLKEMMRQSKSR